MLAVLDFFIILLSFLFNLIVSIGGSGALFLFSSAAPQRTAYSEVPSQMVYHLRTGNPL
jgi:hypothetical protein